MMVSNLSALRSLIAFAALLASSGGLAADPLAGARSHGLEVPMVVTQVPAGAEGRTADWQAQGRVRSDWFDGARVVVVSPQGQMRVLSEGFVAACDPNVSFDGQRVLFAGRKAGADRWRIWEIAVDGTGLRPVTPEHLDARNPIHVPTLFTLESPQPWFTIVFVARAHTTNEAGKPSASSLYNVKLDGTDLRRMTYNPNHSFDPFQMSDGRVIYAAERQPNEPGAGEPRIGLYAIHIEGADVERFDGELSPRIQQMPCATPGGLVITVGSAERTWDGAGQLGCAEERRPYTTYHALTDDPSVVYLHPSPLEANRILVSRRPVAGKATAGVYRFDADTRNAELVFDTAEFHDVQAVAVQPRRRPDGHSTVVTMADTYGTFYGLNAYTTDPKREGQLKPGEIKRVRFIEGVVEDGGGRAARGPGNAAAGPYVGRRLIGEAPVETDGSFNVTVPADTPLQIQTLDDKGLALATSGWVWVRPKEVRGCIGCHQDPELTPENEFVKALRRPSDSLQVPVEARRTVTFRRDVAPILQKSCATTECHGGTKTPLHLPLGSADAGDPDLKRAYARLMVPAKAGATVGAAGQPGSGIPGVPYPGKYIDAGRARTSWLVWQLTGANTSRPWDGSVDRTIKPMPAHEKLPPLSAEEIRTIIEWIDLGAGYEAAGAASATPELALSSKATVSTPNQP